MDVKNKEYEMVPAYMIMDMQYGSTGKGQLAGYLAKMHCPDVVMTAWGPNAGHTYIDDVMRRKFIHTMLANGIVSPNLEYVLIGPGSVIDVNILMAEIVRCADLLEEVTIIIHSKAIELNEAHANYEKNRMVSIGSTMKGTGKAVIDRIARDPDNMPIISSNTKHLFHRMNDTNQFSSKGIRLIVDDARYASAIDGAKLIQIEGAQGFSLSMYHGMYPYTTSRDVTPMQVMADCALPFSIIPEVYGTLRTFPIRVADRYDDKGKLIGTSGPCYNDQREIEWSDIGIEPELTTVTKLPRRIFTFSKKQLDEANRMLNPSKIFVNFVNYMKPDAARKLLKYIDNRTGGKVTWVGTGPSTICRYNGNEEHCDD